MTKILIIGGGFAGCSSARILSENKENKITLIESSGTLGAGVRTNYYGGHPYTFGPRHFLTKNKSIYDYLDSIIKLRNCNNHKFLTYVERDNSFYHFPMHISDIEKMLDSFDKKSAKTDSSKSL